MPSHYGKAKKTMNKGLTKKQKTLPENLKFKIMKAKMKKKT